MSSPLLKTKLNLPSYRSNLVKRPRLLALFDQAVEQQRQFILVSAKAGSGKTTLLSQWVHLQQHPVVWLALDEGDDEPLRFCRYLIAAVQMLPVEISPTLLSMLEMGRLPAPEVLVTALINDMAGSSTPFLLVIDDYHLIRNEWIHQAVGFLVEHLPPEKQLILLTRVDPPLPLARLRGRGQIAEIRGAELVFTTQETAEFLNEVMQLDLSTADIALLEERTEGWIVGLQMAALSMAGHDRAADRSVFIAAFRGTNRYILDYLMEEVLNRQDSHVQDFLLQTSILGRMCASLCAALLDKNSEAESQEILEELERSNLFVVALDDERHWYRYHHLFADLLNSSLRQNKSEAEMRALHGRAADWFQQARHLEEAMIHVMAAQDYERAAALIDENIVSMLSRSAAPILLGWIEKLPPEIVQSLPWVDVYRAYTLALSGQGEKAEVLLAEVETRIDPGNSRYAELLGQIAAIRAFTAGLRGDVQQVEEMAALAETNLPADHLNARGMLAYALIDAKLAADDMEGAQQAAMQMFAVGEKLDRLLMAVPGLCDLALVRKIQGRLRQAQVLYQQAQQWMVRRSGLDTRVRCPYEVGMADLLREWNELDDARAHARRGIDYGQRFAIPSLLISAHVALLRIQQAQGAMAEALDTLRQAENLLERTLIRQSTRNDFNAARVRYWLAAGDLGTAQRWADDFEGTSELKALTLARLHLAQGSHAGTLALLRELRPGMEQGRRNGRLLELLCLQALALDALGDEDEALSTLSQALSLARPEGYLRVFLDLERPMVELLALLTASKERRGEGTAEALTYEKAILDAFGMAMATAKAKASEVGLVEALTEREVEVLRLVAQSLSNKEIAARLIVAPSTIKQHLKNIYGKLDVHNRMQAVQRAQELNLL